LIVFTRILAALVLLPTVLFAAGALHFSTLSRSFAEPAAMALAVLGVAGIVGVFARRLRPALYLLLAALAVTFVWFRSIEPSNDRQWQQDVSLQPWAEVNDDVVTFHNVRNFDYRSETDFTPAWYDKSYKLSDLDELDVVASYWMGKDIAHLLVSFGFGGRDYLAVSIETRKEVGESYSTLAGFFRRYELFYVVADERDLIGVRTNYRKDPPEDVYAYRTNAPRENIRSLFLDYVRAINDLREHPEFYNTLTTNCTTTIWRHTLVNSNANPLSWKILASGHVPEYLYELGRINTSMPFDELERRSRVNDAAQAAGKAADFSQRIRAGLP
jgi:hypothetical protein